MNKFFLVISLFALGILFSCSSNDEVKEEEVISEAEDHDHHHMDEDEMETPLTLNNGERWRLNIEMIPHIENGESLLNLYIENGGADYIQLAEDLAAENGRLIESCTLPADDENHIELHKWLHPHLDITKSLKEADSEEEVHGIIGELIASYATFHEFFQ